MENSNLEMMTTSRCNMKVGALASPVEDDDLDTSKILLTEIEKLRTFVVDLNDKSSKVTGEQHGGNLEYLRDYEYFKSNTERTISPPFSEFVVADSSILSSSSSSSYSPSCQCSTAETYDKSKEDGAAFDDVSIGAISNTTTIVSFDLNLDLDLDSFQPSSEELQEVVGKKRPAKDLYSWYNMANRLRQYQQQHGDCNVPQSTKSLGPW